MRVFRNQEFAIYIRGIDHPPPHCHVRFRNGSQICVMIPLVEPMYGASMDSDVKEAVLDNLDALADAWDLLHPALH